MPSRGFRGSDARIRFSTDVSAIAPAQRLIRRFYDTIINQSKLAAQQTAAIEQQLQLVTQREQVYQNAITNAALAAERRSQNILKAEDSIAKAYQRRDELIDRATANEQRMNIAAERMALRVQKARDASNQALSDQNQLNSRVGRMMERQRDALARVDGAIQRRADSEANAGRRIETSERRLEALRGQSAQSAARYASQITRSDQRIASSRDKLSDSQTKAAEFAALRQQEFAKLNEGNLRRQIQLSQEANALLRLRGGARNQTAEQTRTPQGVDTLIQRLQQARDQAQQLNQTVRVLRFDQAIESARILQGNFQTVAEFGRKTNEQQDDLNRKVNTAATELNRNIQDRQTLENASLQTARDYEKRINAQTGEVQRLQQEYTKLQKTNQRANLQDNQRKINIQDRYAEEIQKLKTLTNAREQNARAYYNLSRREQAAQQNSFQAQERQYAQMISSQIGLIDRLKSQYATLRASAKQSGVEQAQGIEKARLAVVAAQRGLDELIRGASALGAQGAQGLGSIVSSLMSIATTGAGAAAILKALTLATAAAGAAGAYFGVKTYTQIERIQASLSGLTADMQQAKSIIEDGFSLSKDSPIRPDQYLEGARSILAVGGSVQTLSTDLKALAAIAAIANQPLNQISLIYGEILNKNRLYREDLLQFSRRGIPVAQQLAKTLGVTRSEIDQLVSLGAIDFNVFRQAIQDLGAGGSKYSEAFNNVTRTVSGQLDLLINDFIRLSKGIGDVIETFGGFDIIREIIGKARSEVQFFIDYLEALRTTYGFDFLFKDPLPDKNSIGDRAIEEARKLDKSGIENKLRLVARAFNEVSDLKGRITTGSDLTELVEAAKALGQAGFGDLANQISDPTERAEVLKFLETIRQRLQTLSTGGKPFELLPSVAELKIKKSIVDDIPSILEKALSAEERFKLQVESINEKFKEQVAEIEKAIAAEEKGSEKALALEKKKAELLKAQATVQASLVKERDEDLNKAIEKLEDNLKKGNVEDEIANLFPNARNVAGDVADLVIELRKAQEEAAKAGRAFDQGIVAQVERLIALFAELERRREFKDNQQKLEQELKVLEAQARALIMGLDLKRAEADAEVDILLAAGKITEEQARQLKNQNGINLAAGKNVVELVRQKDLAKELADKKNPAKALLQQFQDLRGAMMNFNAGLDEAAAKAQELLFSALGINNAMNFQADFSKGADSIRNRLQQQAIGTRGDQTLPVLQSIRDLVRDMAQFGGGIGLEQKLDKIIQELRKQFGVAPG